MKNNNPILTITGSDGTGQSGIQADIKLISAMGENAVSVITSITVQNTLGIQEIFEMPANMVTKQLEAIINDIQPSVVKIGMIRNVDILCSITDVLAKYLPGQIIYDPIIFSSRNDQLMSEDVIAQMKFRLLPLCSLVIIRKKDAEYLLETNIVTENDGKKAIVDLKNFGCREVLLLEMDDSSYCFHGQSNALSSAIAVYLAKGDDMTTAIDKGKHYIQNHLMQPSECSGRASELFNDFYSKVSTYYRTKRDVKFYADCLNVSSRYLAQVCKKITGNAPKTIIDEHLIREIERMLLNTDKTLQEIAYEFGFSSQAHFTKFFKNLKGKSPSIYRKLSVTTNNN